MAISQAHGYNLNMSFRSLLRGLLLCSVAAMALAQTSPASKPIYPASKPIYKVDPFWPKPLPNKWMIQQIVDIYVDKDDHIWVLSRRSDARPDELGAATNPPRAECCVFAFRGAR